MFFTCIARAMAVLAILTAGTAQAATTNQRLSVLEQRVATLVKAVRALQSVNRTLGKRVTTLEKQASGAAKRAALLQSRVATLERKTAYVAATALNTSLTLLPSTLYPDDFTAAIALPNATSPFEGHLWLTVTVTYGQMSGGFLHYAVEPGTGGSSGERCDGFSPNLWGAGVHTFTVYCALDLAPGSGIRVTAGSFDKGGGTSTAASAGVRGTLLEMKRP